MSDGVAEDIHYASFNAAIRQLEFDCEREQLVEFQELLCRYNQNPSLNNFFALHKSYIKLDRSTLERLKGKLSKNPEILFKVINILRALIVHADNIGRQIATFCRVPSFANARNALAAVRKVLRIYQFEHLHYFELNENLRHAFLVSELETILNRGPIRTVMEAEPVHNVYCELPESIQHYHREVPAIRRAFTVMLDGVIRECPLQADHATLSEEVIENANRLYEFYRNMPFAFQQTYVRRPEITAAFYLLVKARLEQEDYESQSDPGVGSDDRELSYGSGGTGNLITSPSSDAGEMRVFPFSRQRPTPV